MAEKIYPERQRCVKCRKKLEDTVLDGMYCSYSCLGISSPNKDPLKSPRNCRREVSGKWDFKTKYRSASDVPLKLRNDPGTNIYSCDYCHFIHVGHSRPAQYSNEKLRRTVSDVKTLGSVIQRTRENRGISKAVLAKRLKVPAIRLTEIENGEPKMRVDILFAVIYLLKLEAIIQEK